MEKNPKKLVEALGIKKSFGEQVIIPKSDLLLTPKSRVALLGPNGCGKSSLIQILLKQLDPDQGTVFHSEHLQIAYFEQHRDSWIRKLHCCDPFVLRAILLIFKGREYMYAVI